MPKAYGYYRVSTEEQAQEGKSIETQKSLCRKWAKDNNFDLVQEFIDEGKSATTLSGRQSLQDLLEKCIEEKVDIVVVQDTDRLARNTFDHLTIKALLKKQGVRIISISQPMLDESPEGSLIDTIIASVNAFQSQITGRKTSKVLVEKAKLGWFPKIPPLGYINSENPNPTSNLDRRIISIDTKTSPYITKVFEQYATGNFTLKEVTGYLNKMRVKPARGSKVNPNTVNSILKNEFYTGYFTWQKTRYMGKHPALISGETFQRVQNVLQNHNRNASRKRKYNFLLNGFLYSIDSRRKMIGEFHRKPNGKTYSYYCATLQRADTYINSIEMEKRVEQFFENLEISKEYSNKVIDTAKNILQQSRSSQSDNRKRITNELSKVEKAINELEDSRFITGEISNDNFVRAFDRYNADRNLLTEELSSLNKDDSENIHILEKILRLAENLGTAYKEADDNLKRSYLNLFIDKLYVDKGKIVDFKLTDEVEGLIEEGSVQIRRDWGGLRGSNP